MIRQDATVTNERGNYFLSRTVVPPMIRMISRSDRGSKVAMRQPLLLGLEAGNEPIPWGPEMRVPIYSLCP